MTTSVDTVRHFYDALGRGDVPAVLSLLDAEIKWTEAERFPYYSGTWQGPQAVLDKPQTAFQRMGRVFRQTARVYR